MHGSDYAVWLMPGSETRRFLRELIQEIARWRGTPLFEPHMTLIHRLEGREGKLVDRLVDLAGQLSPLKVSLGKVETQPTYFRSLYLPVQTNPAVERAYTLAGRLFEHTPAEPFTPHFSLLYGDIDLAEKLQVIDRVAASLPASIHCDQLALYRLSGSPQVWSAVRLVDL